MTPQKQIVVEIDEGGEYTVDLLNFNGKGCDKALADVTGLDIQKNVVTKPEYQQMPLQKKVQVIKR
jgi:hypothetical protein